MEEDTDGTVAAWQDAREDVIKPEVSSHNGKIVKLTSDGFLVEFPTVQDAVNCAITMQEGLTTSSLDFRMGIDLGDIVDDGEDIHGEGVNVAARIEALADAGGISISSSVYEQVRNRIDANYQDRGEHKVKNVSSPIRVFAILLKSGDVHESDISAPVKSFDGRPIIAVLPFDNMSSNTEDDYFSDGLTEDIITELSRFRDLAVIARNSTFQYKTEGTDMLEFGKKLGANYIVEGSIRRAGPKVRITAQLIDLSTGLHVWADRYDRGIEDIFAVQDEVTQTIAAQLGVRLQGVALERALKKNATELDAYDCLLRARRFTSTLDKQMHSDARDLLEQAIKIDPGYGDAYALLANVYLAEHRFDLNPLPNSVDRAMAMAQKATELDPLNAYAHCWLAIVHFFKQENTQFKFEAQRAIELNPNDPETLADIGHYYAFMGEFEAGVELTRRAMELNPLHPGWYYFSFARHHYSQSKYEETLADIGRVNLPQFYWARLIEAATLGQLGRSADEVIASIFRLKPDFSARTELEKWNADPIDAEHLMDGLIKAGLPESSIKAKSTASSDKPSIAVLPFDNLSGDPEQEYLGDGLAEDIITALSHIRQFFVIARNSTFQYKNKSPDIRTVAEELGVRYVLEGSVRKAGERLRITAQLIDAETGNHLWAEKYDRNIDDIFAIQDEMTQAIVAQLEPELSRAEFERTKTKSAANLDAWELYHRGVAFMYLRDETSIREARALFESAINQDPDLASAHAAFAHTIMQMSLFGFENDALNQGMAAAQKAVQLDSRNAICHCELGWQYWIKRKMEDAIASHRRAVELNPSFAFGHWSIASSLAYGGYAVDTLHHGEMAIKLSPSDPSISPFYGRMCSGYLFLDQIEEAVDWGRKSVRETITNWITVAYYAAALGCAGLDDEAGTAIKTILDIQPKASVELVDKIIPITHRPYKDKLLDGLRKAGLPEK